LPTFDMTRRVPFSAQQMFDVVADVERYPEFLPLCEGLIVRSREAQGGNSVLTATMTVGYGAIRESFSSRVTLKPGQKEIHVTYLDGPFHHLDNRWRFRDAPGGSEIYFFIDYAFASRLLGLLMGAMFDRAVKKYAEAFEVRARIIYAAPVAASGVAPGES
jgi:coenzyme Q-binding protein COQ10